MCNIFKDGVVVDASGPWESEDAATTWAEEFVNKCNNGYEPFGSV
jgi:hypothetical protein